MKKSLIHVALVGIAALLVLSIAAALSAPVHTPALAMMQFDMPSAWQLIGVGMTTLAADKARAFELGDVRAYPVIATDIIYEGAAVGDNGSGYARPLVAGDPFRGFAESKADNSAGSAGAINVRVKERGIVQLSIGSLAITDVGKPVYASDDDTFTLTASTNSAIGRVVAFVSTGVGMVEFNAARGSLGSFTALTDSSGGTASDTIALIGATYVQAEVRNAVASLAAKINTLAGLLK